MLSLISTFFSLFRRFPPHFLWYSSYSVVIISSQSFLVFLGSTLGLVALLGLLHGSLQCCEVAGANDDYLLCFWYGP